MSPGAPTSSRRRCCARSRTICAPRWRRSRPASRRCARPDAAFTDADRAELLSEIEEESDRLERLVRNLLDASRVEAGSLRIHKRPQDMRELVTSAVSRVRPLTAGRERARRRPRGPAAVGLRLPADRAGRRQPARECGAAHAAEAPIAVAAACEDDCVRVEVADAGPAFRRRPRAPVRRVRARRHGRARQRT